jgi:alkaline phosphatase
MVEGGRIDHAEHQHDAAAAIQEALDFDAAVAVALDFAARDGATLVLVTADHETGGLSLGSEAAHDVNLGALQAARASLGAVARQLLASDDAPGLLAAQLGLTDLTTEELGAIVTVARSGERAAAARLLGPLSVAVSRRSGVTWTTWDHTAEDVPVWAAGPGAARFAGHHANTHIALALAELLGLRLESAASDTDASRSPAPAGGTR